MNEAQKRIQISGRELAYLRRASFLPSHLAYVIGSAQIETNGARYLTVARDVAEAFRSAFTDRLAKGGFGGAYELTPEGRMLEELIDRFDFGDVP